MRKEIENDEIASERVDTVSKLSYRGSSGTETEKCCDLEDYPGGTPEDHIENPIHQRLIEITHEAAKGDIPILHSRDITLVTKYVNEVNEVLKCISVISVRKLSELKHVVRVGALLVCEKVGVKTDRNMKRNHSGSGE